jgi:ABC-2 type transport system permease protein
MWQILKKEINSFFNSLVAYLVVVVFLIGTGLISWVFPQTSILEAGFANLDPLFTTAPYVFMFLVPAITMRSLAEEKKGGTIELLLTRPLTDLQIILGKYLACLLLAFFALVPTLVYYYTVIQLGSPVSNIDHAATWGSYLGLVLLAAVFTAIGIFSSSLTDNQIVAFITAFFLSFFLYDGFSALGSVNVWSAYTYYISQAGIDYHYASVSRGLIDLRNIFYFFTLIATLLYLTRLVLQSRKW